MTCLVATGCKHPMRPNRSHTTPKINLKRHPTHATNGVVKKVSRRLTTLIKRMITWTSGEAYVPGPQNPPYKPHVNDVRFRFHNVQGLTDKKFRPYYLSVARSNCEVLALAETNCPDDATAHVWAKDWQGSGGAFWATAPHKCRGMAILLSSTLGATGAHVVWKLSLIHL